MAVQWFDHDYPDGRQLELGHYRAQFLQSYGIHVVFPESKQEAISAVRAGGYDAILLSNTLSNETIQELVSLIWVVLARLPDHRYLATRQCVQARTNRPRYRSAKDAAGSHQAGSNSANPRREIQFPR